MSSNGVELSPLDESALPEVLTLFDEALGSGHDLDWFQWKHRDNPAGASLGWVARDEEGVVGVRLLMRWALRANGGSVQAVRPVDTVTASRARRRGIFSRLATDALVHLEKSGDVDLVFNTPNANSRDGYRRMGWSLLEPIWHRIRPGRPSLRPPRLVEGPEAAEVFGGIHLEKRLHTVRTPAFITWRYDVRSGHDYRLLSLAEADTPQALVYRVLRRRSIRLIAVDEWIGSARGIRELVSAALRRESALGWIAADGAGSDEIPGGFGLRRGFSVVAVRKLQPLVPEPTKRSSWALTLGDLEDVI